MNTKAKDNNPITDIQDAMKTFLALPGSSGNPAFDAWLSMGTEAMQFLSNRMQQDLKTQQALLECKKPEDLQRIQTEFFQTAMDQYAAEATKMMQTLTDATKIGLSAATPGAARKKDDIPL